MNDRMKNRMAKLYLPVVVIILFVLFVVVEPFYDLEARVSDNIYSQLEGTNRNIKIIAVDEETLSEYGTFTDWSRDKCAELIEVLNSNGENAPVMIGMDFLFVSETDETADTRLVKACEAAGNVVFGSNVVYRGTTKFDEKGKAYYDSWNVNMVEEPYESLKEATESGFTNVHIANDGCVRYTKLTEIFEEEEKNSFAYLLYKKYSEITGEQIKLPKCDNRGLFTFFYSGENGEFAHYSMKDVIDGTIPAEEFAGSIVLVGAYAPGFQDAYVATVDRGTPMYGVEIHANIIQALMDGKTAVAVNIWAYMLTCAVVLGLFCIVANKQKLIPVLIESSILIMLHIVAGRFMALKGHTIPQLYFIASVIIVMLYFIVEKYFGEKLRRKKVLATFKKYVAPQIVDKISKDGTYELKLGGEKRNIAVLFVDIRGFTPMSESLNPEQVVSILNEYLALTTDSVLSNEGTLDKFIGDATMAVFNAPFDLEDYIYKAILTALAIRDGSDKLAARLQEKFGKTISYGIGVNCGDAVVGNIGCEFRMDYTAIGDTVNTAARLESRAKAGEILISEAVYREVENRIEAECVGEMELKGKSRAVNVYRLIGIKG